MSNEIIEANGPKTVQSAIGEEVSLLGGMSPAVAAAEARARAEVQAAAYMASTRPRDVDLFRERILKDCRRPMFAEAALYHRPAGREKDPATGAWRDAFAVNFSIRFIESALQHWTNVHVSALINWGDAEQALMTVRVLDLERNVTYSTDTMLEKTVERKEVKKGRTVKGVRENSYGETVYLVEATKDEFRNVMGAERSKLIRDNGQRLLPRDILEEARMVIDATVLNEAAKDPDSARKKILDKFASIGISAAMLKEYLGVDQPIEGLTADGLNHLGAMFNGLKEGTFTWPDLMRTRTEAAEAGGPVPAPGGARKLKDRILPQQQPLTPDEGTKK